MKQFKIEFHSDPLILSETATTFTKTIKDVVIDLENMGFDMGLIKSISEVEEPVENHRKYHLLTEFNPNPIY